MNEPTLNFGRQHGDGGHSSLPFFAVTCAALATGALSSPPSERDALVPFSAQAFYTLSQQALGIWDTHVSSLSKRPTTKDDTEQLDYLLACLIGVVYLLESGTVMAASADVVGDDVQDEDMELNEDMRVVSSLVRASLLLMIVSLDVIPFYLSAYHRSEKW
jgi:hypothetical protein